MNEQMNSRCSKRTVIIIYSRTTYCMYTVAFWQQSNKRKS